MNLLGLLSGILLSVEAFFGLHVIALDTPRATVLFGGDMMFDRTVRTTVYNKGGDFIFSCLDPLLKQQDLVVANLEGPITTNPSTSELSSPGDSNNYTFTFPLSTADLLVAHNIRLVNIGNNHIENFGNDGVRSTIATLTHSGVDYFGDPISFHEATTTINSIPLAFINYNEFGPSDGGRASGNASTTLHQIRDARAEGFIPVVYTHWGIEYEVANDNQKSLAHQFVDAGAEIVIGSHPHVVQEHEVYKGKYIYYSLGNLIFDQYWDDAVRHGLMLQITFGPTGIETVKEISVELEHDRRTCEIPSSQN